jgi:hypothetical protein
MSLFEKEERDVAMEYMDKKLRFRIRSFFVILFVMLGVLGFDLYKDQVTLINILAGIFVGGIVGLVLGRMFKIYWHPTDRKVVARLDAVGIGSLIFYILFAIFREKIFAHYVQASHLRGFVFSTVAGVMIGRILTMGFHIKKTIKNNVEEAEI